MYSPIATKAKMMTAHSAKAQYDFQYFFFSFFISISWSTMK